MPEKSPSAGKTVAASGGVVGAAIVVLLYASKHLGLDDMTPAVAASIITLATGLTGLIMHNSQRAKENSQP